MENGVGASQGACGNILLLSNPTLGPRRTRCRKGAGVEGVESLPYLSHQDRVGSEILNLFPFLSLLG